MKLQDRNCPVCMKSTTSTVAYPAAFNLEQLDGFSYSSRKLPEYMHFRLLECNECRCVYSSPAPTFKELSTLYKSADFSSAKESSYAATKYSDLVLGIKPSISTEAKVLDIGAGDGSFLLALHKLGFKHLTGVEPSVAPLQYADPVIRDCIRNEMFNPDQLSQKFDLITLFQTIEHVENPRVICEAILKLLSPDGIFVIVCHNYDSVSRKLLGSKSPIFDIEHLQLFRPRSIIAMLKHSGFNEVNVKTIWNTYPILYWIKLFPIPASCKSFMLKLLEHTIGRIPLSIPAGNMMVTARR